MYGTGYDYIFDPRSSTGIGSGAETANFHGLAYMEKRNMDERVRKEFNKYFGVYASNASGAPGEADPYGTAYADSALRFLTPRCIKTFGKDPVDIVGKIPERYFTGFDKGLG